MDFVNWFGVVICKPTCYLFTVDNTLFHLEPKTIGRGKRIQVYKTTQDTLFLSTVYYRFKYGDYIKVDGNCDFLHYFTGYEIGLQLDDNIPHEVYVPKPEHLSKLYDISIQDWSDNNVIKRYTPAGIFYDDFTIRLYSQNFLEPVTDPIEIQDALVHGLDTTKLIRVNTNEYEGNEETCIESYMPIPPKLVSLNHTGRIYKLHPPEDK